MRKSVYLFIFTVIVSIFQQIMMAYAQSSAAAGPPKLVLTFTTPPETFFTPAKHACDGNDVPDANPRAFRDDKGSLVLTGMHFENRIFRGPDFDHLKLDCKVVYRGEGDADTSRYNDRAWLSATWTEDGKTVFAVSHHEAHSNRHPGQCIFNDEIKCWFNTLISLKSLDSGASFIKTKAPAVIAAFPYPQSVGQGRHRGFFQPSNIFSDGKYKYFFAATTGWDGQKYGACLFRNADITNPDGWRAYDGKGFNARFPDPYGKFSNPLESCAPVSPFGLPVGSVTRHLPSGNWVAVFSSTKDTVRFPVSGIYYATARSLLEWSKPRLLLATPSLYDSPCEKGVSAQKLVSYPAMIDRNAVGRNFDDVGTSADLYYSQMHLDGCNHSSNRDLIRRGLQIKPAN